MNFNRRQYIKSVGASVALPFTQSLETNQEEQEQEERENEYYPVYATVKIQEYDLNLAHISIPSEDIERSDYIHTNAGSVRLDDVSTENGWGIVNVLVDGGIESISVGRVEATRWDTFSFEKIGLLYTGSSEHSFLDVYSAEEDLNRSRIEATDPTEVDTDDEEESVPIFEVDMDHII